MIELVGWLKNFFYHLCILETPGFLYQSKAIHGAEILHELSPLGLRSKDNQNNLLEPNLYNGPTRVYHWLLFTGWHGYLLVGLYLAVYPSRTSRLFAALNFPVQPGSKVLRKDTIQNFCSNTEEEDEIQEKRGKSRKSVEGRKEEE